MKRRNFIRKTGLTGLGLSVMPTSYSINSLEEFIAPAFKPVCITTWNFHEANKKAGKLLDNKTSALDAVEQGVRVEEKNIKNHTVGNGGTPDRDGFVTLDASIMGPDGDCGSVAFLQNIEHPISVARKIMERTPHKMLVGKGAYSFAINNGFKPKNLLSPESREKWEEWLEHKDYKPIINIENHDTIGMLCLDQNGDMAGACTTSGLAYKMHGRVGDSPIIGSGLFVDNEVGGAVATGLGEEIMKNVSSFLIVELMRQGKSPQESCEIAMQRLISKNPSYNDFQVAFLALNKKGEVGSFCIHQGFTFMKYAKTINENISSKSLL
ncbi:N(4)-(beta-N-acetylglucosaminyl)-L-asparaginase [Salegentibacter flavus]|uniref:N4-(Beta-N-acetylglucosaminyl)-L-asparaginase n=1 Tax=Salegentibacter flavus TaxID=287099 RepID=A0A1I4ZDY6_9FLAO|nr:N(4)-(beta-N-acetylglucosaminyl)-L-asparaginase [Salegentibacter flavus]SFN48417.1 N4-(beta-N-acetylglucosaminyl)-L-asparaginase [Salegentibacter flavus]